MMKNNKMILTAVLVAITLVFLGVVIVLTMKQQIVPNQTTQAPVTIAPSVAPVTLELKPQTLIENGKLFTVDVVYSGITQPIIAADILLKYDPTYLEFADTQNIDALYMNPRKLYENNTLIVSFIRKPATEKTAAAPVVTMGQIVFRAKQKGTVSLSPVLTTGSRTSLVFVEGNQVNQLGTGNAVDIVIK